MEATGGHGHVEPPPLALGPGAKKDLQRNLTKSEPLAFIRQFQNKNGLGEWSNCSAAMPMVDLQGVARPDVYRGLLLSLRSRLLGKLQDLSEPNLKALLVQSFPYILLPEIRPIVLEVLRLQKAIPDEFLQTLSTNPELMASCAIEVKRQVWQHRPKLFSAEVRPRLLTYLARLRKRATVDGLSDYDTFSPRKRRDTSAVKEILKLIGKSVPLYNETLRALRTQFVETGDIGCCALRTDLLMGLSDSGITTIVKRDPLQQFVECLIVCVTDRAIDEKKAATLSRSLEAVEVGPMIGDIGMVILDPCIQVTLSKACFAAVQDSVHGAMLPSKSAHLQCLTRVLTVVNLEEIRRMMRDQAFEKLDVPDTRVLPWFYPTLAAAMVEDRITATVRQRESGAAGISHATSPPPEFIEVLKGVPVLRVVVMHYMQDRLAAKDIASVAWALPLLADTVTGEWVYGDHEEASTDEQFVRTVVQTLTTSLRTQFAGAGELALRMMTTFFVPRAHRTVPAHADAIALATVLRREATEANTVAVDAVVAELCEDGALPGVDTVEGEGASPRDRLVSAYGSLVGELPHGSTAAAAAQSRLSNLSQR